MNDDLAPGGWSAPTCWWIDECDRHGRYVRQRWMEPPGGCSWCDQDRTRAARDRRNAVRRPPRPPFEKVPNACAMCGTPPAGRRRTWCSDACVHLWNVAMSSLSATADLVEVFGRRCWLCDRATEPGAVERWDVLGYVRVAQTHDRWRGPGDHCPRPLYGPPDPRMARLYVDHVRPLWSLTGAERTELRWWLPFNLQLLCHWCHADKTRAEAGERAALRRAS